MDIIRIHQDYLIELAEKKLNRKLTDREIDGIRKIHSGLMLESIEREWEWPGTSLENIEKGLEHWATQDKPFKI